MEEISRTDRVRNEEVLQIVKVERNVLRAIKRKKTNLIGHILYRNCFRIHVIVRNIEGRIEGRRRRRRRHKQLLDELKEKERIL